MSGSSIIALALTLLPTAVPASDFTCETKGNHPYRGKRIAVVIDEFVEGKKQVVSPTENVLIGCLSSAGVRFIDPMQAHKLRAATNAKSLLQGAVPTDVITSLEADFVLAGVVQADPLKSEMLKGVIAYEMTGNVKVIAADSAQVTDTLSISKVGQGFTRGPAISTGGRRIALAMAEALLKSPKSSETAIDLLVRTDVMLSFKVASEIHDGVKTLEGVKGSRIVHQGDGAVKIEIITSQSAQRIAGALDDLRAGGIVVDGVSNLGIKATWAPTAGARMKLILGRLNTSRKLNKEASALSSVLGASVDDCKCVDIAAEGEVFDLRRKKQQAQAKAGVPKRQTLLLTGRASVIGKDVALTAKIVRATGGVVLSKHTRCPRRNAAECAATLGQRLAPALRKWVATNGGFVKPKPQRALQLVSTSGSDLYPARITRYANKDFGIGSIEFENTRQRHAKARVAASFDRRLHA